ncbi:MAG TPA: trypsin-like peptidase domain-containing protein [Acetobacteraceae bacterium]|nr:trypsin-like peptidase domain-containing protein [Acetobacteraceae bacterium]
MRLSATLKVLLACLIAVAPAARAQEMQYDRSALIQSLLPAVVNITALVVAAAPAPSMAGAMADPGLSSSEQKRQLGSGFVIDPKGEIITNYHVIDGAYEIIATFSDGMQLEAKVAAADRLADIALLNVEPPAPLQAAQWGDSGAVRVGDPVLAVGNPLGVGLSVTGGIVSALNRNIMETPYDDYIQTDAPINHGNSGGPLFDMRGHVVGINTAIISPTAGSAGLGFAIPAGDARFVIGQLRRFGWLHPGWLGIKVQQVTPEMAEALGMTEPRGSIVAHVSKSGGAAAAGIQVGDIVLAYNGTTPSDERALLRDIAQTAPGTRVGLTIQRQGGTREVAATVGEWPRQNWERFDAPIAPVKATQVIQPDLGLTVAPLLNAQRIRLSLGPEVPGILITAVAPGTDAAWRGVVAGDAILRVQDRVMRSPADYIPALDAARAEHRQFVLLLMQPLKQTRPGPEWRALQIAP